MNISTISTRLSNAFMDYQFTGGYAVHDSDDMHVCVEYAYVKVFYNGERTDKGLEYRFKIHEHYDSLSNKLLRLRGKHHKVGKVTMQKAFKGKEKVYDWNDDLSKNQPWNIPLYDVMNKHFDVVTTYNPYEPIARVPRGW